jgi:prepilin-type N-terminal cleavage/methylation domain-containing protein
MRRNRGGYTIIEVLIVLAVGVIIFFAAIALFAGKQGKTEFSQAMRDVESQMQSVVNDVGVSVFPNSGDFDCTLSGGKPTLSTTTADTGTNQDCIFLGKAVVADSEADPDQLVVYTVLGSRVSGGSIVTSVTESDILDANPVPFTINGPGPDLTETYTIPFGAEVISAKTDLDFGPNAQTRLVGFYNGQQSGTDQGSLSLLTLGYIGLKNTGAPGQVKSSIENNSPHTGKTIKKWSLCFKSGTSDEMATLNVLSSSAGISTSIAYGDCS